MKLRLKITVRGAVQGVGFRPFVYRLATSLGVTGYVLNTGAGVIIEAENTKEVLDRFLLELEKKKPPLAIIQSLEFSFLDPVHFVDFEIRESRHDGDVSALVLPDIAVCEDCLREMNDPSDRRYHYPFINCTNCGPRFSIIEALPYDRPLTSMKIFQMCDNCREEYENPADRRFHAQPVACPKCGPQLELWNENGKTVAVREAALLKSVEFIRSGKIVAVKGLGGFHLMCDATNAAAVERLRKRKHREEKPFAVMMPSLEMIKDICEVSPLEERLLLSPESPIVLLKRKYRPENSHNLQVDSIAPDNPYLGVMLPYTPLHHLLLTECGAPVVATSGNISEEPMCIDEQQALKTLNGITDLFLVHDRPIVRHVDDSIGRIILGREMIMRRARGYAPLPVEIDWPDEKEVPHLEPTLAVGGHLKNTVAVGKGHSVFVSQHIGDLSTQESLQTFQRVVDDFQNLFQVDPQIIVSDMHPEYLSSKMARSRFPEVLAVQHHEAHIAACRAENQLTGPAMGVSWDGTGYGRDETVWGGEFFLSDDAWFEHVARFRSFSLPGGEEAVREPRRSALGILYELSGADIFEKNQFVRKHFTEQERRFFSQMLEKEYNCPRTSSAGRLFDAVAALLNVRQKIAYEGQAAMMLEYLAADGESAHYPAEIFPGKPLVVDWEPMILQILDDLANGLERERISARFHNGLAHAILAIALQIGAKKVIMSGGCFQNAVLLENSVRLLRSKGFLPYWHQRIPPNDGGISLGQVVMAQRQKASFGKSAEHLKNDKIEINE